MIMIVHKVPSNGLRSYGSETMIVKDMLYLKSLNWKKSFKKSNESDHQSLVCNAVGYGGLWD